MIITGDMAERENQTGTPQMLRSMNEHILLERLRAHGPLSRAQLARETGLSKPTVSLALANLEQVGLVRMVGQRGSERGGRQAILYAIDPTAGYVVGLDIGRSWVRVALADLAGTIIARRKVPNDEQSAEALVALATELAHNLVADAGFSWSQVVHTVIGTPGSFNSAEGRVLFAANLPNWGRVGLLEMLRASLSSSLTLENDANLAAIGECTFGCGTTIKTFVFLTIGTGTGMGIIINGTLYRGAHGAGGEIGFLPFPTTETTHLPSYRGLLEEATSADAIVQMGQENGMWPLLTAQQIFDAARAGDITAQGIVEQEGERLALAIASIAAILDPELIVLGGGIGHNVDLLRPSIERRLREITPLQPYISASTLGEDVILLGAIATALTIARDYVFQQRSREKDSGMLQVM